MKFDTRKLRDGLAVLGWQGVAGAVLLLMAVALHYFVASAQSARLDALQHESSALKVRAAPAARGELAAAGGADEVARFYAYFSGPPSTEWLKKVYAAAAASNLVLERGEYRGTPVNEGRLLRYQVTLPVKGSYPQIRRFVDQVLTDVPVAAMDDISFKRETIGTTQIEARIRLSLFVGTRK
jgi:hypothetical protein